MNRAFKIQFFNDDPEKIIVTMGVTVNNGKKFRELDEAGRVNLVINLQKFQKQVDAFTREVAEGHYYKTKDTPKNLHE